MLIEILRRLAKKPNENRQIKSLNVLDALPMHTNDKLYSTPASTTTLLLPSVPTSNPANGSDTKKPTGRAKSIVPSIEGLRLKFSWMLGIRDAQLAKHNPCRKKTILIAIRLIRRVEGLCFKCPTVGFISPSARVNLVVCGFDGITAARFLLLLTW